MKNIAIVLFVVLAFTACNQPVKQQTVVTNEQELKQAIKDALPGHQIVMANGVWKDIVMDVTCNGDEKNPITVSAETPGQVFIEGESCLNIGGDYIVIEGLFFRNGHTPKNAVIRFRKDKQNVANHCKVSNCVIKDFNQPNRSIKDHWVEFWGRHNQLDHCYLAGKSNSGPTVRVFLKGNQNILNYHKISNNHFGPRPRKGGPRGETIQIGDSYTSMCPSYVNVSNNLFEKCNGEVEVISSKSNYNEFSGNVFYQCEGSLVTRHGNYCKIDGNYFIGNEGKNIGGIRLINTGHWVTNNYFYNLRGSEFRSPLAVMNGIPKSPLNRYLQVTDAVIAYNTYVNCSSPWQFGIGNNIDQGDVLPKSEIRSDRPDRCVVANNLIYNEEGDSRPIVAHDKLDGVDFKNNVISNNNTAFEKIEGISTKDITMTALDEYVHIPSNKIEEKAYHGFDFDLISEDILGNSRKKQNQIGAMVDGGKYHDILDRSHFGANWYSEEKKTGEQEVIQVQPGKNGIINAIQQATPLHKIVLAPGVYHISSSLLIDKMVRLASLDSSDKAIIKFEGQANTPLFMMGPKGHLILSDIQMKGNETNGGIETLKENMSSHYQVMVDGCDFDGFMFLMTGNKYSMAQEIEFTNCSFRNSTNGFQFAQEIEDKGEYNVEYLTFEDCKFTNIESNVINYYRGGYDESTIGGNLNISDCHFSNCGSVKNSDRLINCTGIIYVDIHGSSFVNNPVQHVTVLWGAKENYESQNEITNSGTFKKVQNIELNLMY